MSERILRIGDRDFPVEIHHTGNQWLVRRGETTNTITLLGVTDHEAELEIDGRRRIVPWTSDGKTVSVFLDGEVYAVGIEDGRSRSRQKEHSLTAPMPGIVLRIAAEVGDAVSKGAPLIVLEAMKMEHVITAPYDGIVEAIHCEAGELVAPGIDLISLGPAGGAA